MSAFAFEDGVGYHACSPMRADWTASGACTRSGRRREPGGEKRHD
jgi:hypothetical protein